MAAAEPVVDNSLPQLSYLGYPVIKNTNLDCSQNEYSPSCSLGKSFLPFCSYREELGLIHQSGQRNIHCSKMVLMEPQTTD